MAFELQKIEISPPNRKPKNWILTLDGPLGSQTVRDLKKPVRLYVENNTEIHIEYVEFDDSQL